MDILAWCKRMEASAATGDDAYNYYQLHDQWKQRLGTKDEPEAVV